MAALKLFLLSQQLRSGAVKRKYGPIAGSAASQQLNANRLTRSSLERDLTAVRIDRVEIYTSSGG